MVPQHVLDFSSCCEVLEPIRFYDDVIFNSHSANFPETVENGLVDVFAELWVIEYWLDDEAAEIYLPLIRRLMGAKDVVNHILRARP